MADITIGQVSEFADPGRKIVELGDKEFAIFRLDGKFYAYENHCPHLGGPACQGRMLPLTLEAVQDDKTSEGRVFSKDRQNVVCPWHGMEFDIRTGVHPTTSRFRLRKVPVKQEREDVIITLSEA